MTLFDIIVPTFKRYKDLPIFFEKNNGLQNENVHVWIIDDCSPDFDSSVFPDWPNITLIRLTENGGQAHARNVAIENGSAPYVISLDDDAWFTNVSTAIKDVQLQFREHSDVGCIMFNIATPDSSYSSMNTGTLVPLHVTCGCAYRRETLEKIGGFSGFLHSGAEETDISMRIYKEGWRIIFSNEIKVFHNFVPAARTRSWHYHVRYNTTRNDLLIVLMNYPAVVILPFIIGKLISHLKFAVRHQFEVVGTVWVTMKAFVGFLRLGPQAIKQRNPLSWAQFKFWRSLF